MANDTTLMSTASSVLKEVVTSNENNTGGFVLGVSANLWRYGWPPLCMMGLVGNTLVLLVLRRDGLVRTSAYVYLSALAVGDSLVLMVTSVAIYPGRVWGWWFYSTSRLACHVVSPINHTLAVGCMWFIVAFTVERCVVVRFPLLKLRLCTPRNAGLCCGSLLVLAFVKNIDLFFVDAIVVSTDVRWGLHCTVVLSLCRGINSYTHHRNRCRILIHCKSPTSSVNINTGIGSVGIKPVMPLGSSTFSLLFIHLLTVSRRTMANDTALMSTASSVLEDVVTSNENNTGDFVFDVSANIWRYGWPPLCMTGLVGNTLVLLVLRRDGLVRTSASVYLSALAVGDSLVLMVTSVALYTGKAWGWWFDSTSRLACHVTWPVLHTIINASTWFIVAFTVERCVVVRFPLLKLRLCTPRNAGLCCGSLLVLAFVKNIDLFFLQDFVVDTVSDDVICTVQLSYRDYVTNYRPMISFVTSCVIPIGIVLVCNWAIIRTLRRDLVQTTARDSIVRHTTVMCLAVSFAFIVCVAPAHVFYVTIPNWPMSLQDQYDVLGSLLLLRYANHAINFFLYSLTGAHFRCELVALFRRCIQRAFVTAGCVRRMTSRLTGLFHYRRETDHHLEMR